MAKDISVLTSVYLFFSRPPVKKGFVIISKQYLKAQKRRGVGRNLFGEEKGKWKIKHGNPDLLFVFLDPAVGKISRSLQALNKIKFFFPLLPFLRCLFK